MTLHCTVTLCRDLAFLIAEMGTPPPGVDPLTAEAAAPDALHSPWLIGTHHSVETRQLLLGLPCFLEVIVPSLVTEAADCYGILRVMKAYPPTEVGIFTEGTLLGASDPDTLRGLSTLWSADPPPVIHFCFGDIASSMGVVDMPGRWTLHVNTVRARSLASLTEP